MTELARAENPSDFRDYAYTLADHHLAVFKSVDLVTSEELQEALLDSAALFTGAHEGATPLERVILERPLLLFSYRCLEYLVEEDEASFEKLLVPIRADIEALNKTFRTGPFEDIYARLMALALTCATLKEPDKVATVIGSLEGNAYPVRGYAFITEETLYAQLAVRLVDILPATEVISYLENVERVDRLELLGDLPNTLLEQCQLAKRPGELAVYQRLAAVWPELEY